MIKSKIRNADYEVTASSKLALGLGELWIHHQLIWVMIWKEVLIRYKQTLMGVTWVLIQPIVTVSIFAIIFNRIMHVSADGIPYVPFALTGIIGWVYFTHAVTKATNCLLDNYIVLNKVYFPRVILPITATLGGLIDFFIGLLLVIVAILFYQIPVTINFLFFPLFLLIIVLNALAVGFWLSAINIRYRDVNNLLPFLLQAGLFVTPVAYPLEMADEKWRFFFMLNPISGALSGLRWALLGTEFPTTVELTLSIGITMLFVVAGFLFFKNQEQSFSDLL